MHDRHKIYHNSIVFFWLIPFFLESVTKYLLFIVSFLLVYTKPTLRMNNFIPEFFWQEAYWEFFAIPFFPPSYVAFLRDLLRGLHRFLKQCTLKISILLPFFGHHYSLVFVQYLDTNRHRSYIIVRK